MDGKDLRDPLAERRARRLALVAVVVIVALASGAAGLAALAHRPLDHHYRYSVVYTDTNGAPYRLEVPVPADAEFAAGWTTLGNVTASIVDSPYGKWLRIDGRGDASAASYLDTWRDVPLTLTTENVEPPTGHRVILNYTPVAPGTPFLRLSVREIDPTFTTERFVVGDLVGGVQMIDIREELDHN